MMSLGRSVSVIAVHGFLGLPSDWIALLGPEGSHRRYACPWTHGGDLAEMAEHVRVEALSCPAPRILVGYSLGGRIAMHALLQSPTVFAGAVVISSHPGLVADQNEREARIEADERWAKRFEQEDWHSVIQEWNNQPVLRGYLPALTAREECFDRKSLAASLRQCSLGRQEDLRSRLRDLNVPVLWMGGEMDERFGPIMREGATLSPQYQCQIVEHAGHRVPWDQPRAFLQGVEKFIRTTVLKTP